MAYYLKIWQDKESENRERCRMGAWGVAILSDEYKHKNPESFVYRFLLCKFNN